MGYVPIAYEDMPKTANDFFNGANWYVKKIGDKYFDYCYGYDCDENYIPYISEGEYYKTPD